MKEKKNKREKRSASYFPTKEEIRLRRDRKSRVSRRSAKGKGGGDY